METWAPVKNLEKYEVSTSGRVRNASTGKLLNGSVNNRGYIRFDLCINGRRIVKHGHNLVANAFIEPAPGKPYINHKDGDKTNNHVDNLEWCTPQENAIHSAHVLGNEPTNRRPVLCEETGRVYESVLEAERQTGVFNSQIVRCCKGRTKTAGKMHWRYADAV